MKEQQIFVCYKRSGSALRLTRLPFNGYQVSFLQVKRQGREVDHSPLCNAEAKNEWSYNLFAICLYGVERENFTLLQ